MSEVLVPGGDRAVVDALLGRIAAARADYLLRLGTDGVTAGRFVRLPRMGPVLVGRSLGDVAVPGPAGWALTMGDVELL